ncbi:peptidase E [Catellatospora sp. TT07R-123]|uniref:Type 1 glutamine amidotransferase-like domain-containing protein n=1 Tax=Catellatospora sp. TT07R-123 TaxID=2733863 RepID=UPI001B27FA71|nr:Type 1 glutamine amidotransferase-like domain-containing protein [Catellatospora sp. TT07R-123]GHJ47178.1 peptidase E [Catellatospora sp. TT07R-123]
MKLLLTDSGIQNRSIRDALVDLLGKPIEESTALIVPTALHAQQGGAVQAYRVVSGQEDRAPMAQLGWKSLGLLELTALPSIGEQRWVPLVEEADALLVEGGDPMFLAYWMRESGLAGLLPTLSDTVYVGLSAGSMVMTPRIGEDFVRWSPPDGGDQTLGMVDFAIFPHLDYPGMTSNSMANAEKWAAAMPMRAYAIDNQTAIKVTGADVEVVSEGQWRLFNS